MRIPHHQGDVPVLHGPGKIEGVQQSRIRSYRGEQGLDHAKDKVIYVGGLNLSKDRALKFLAHHPQGLIQ